jgi:hypothetical protein
MEIPGSVPLVARGRRSILSILAVLTVVLAVSAPAGADTATIALGTASVVPGSPVQVTATFSATGPVLAAFEIRVTPEAGSSGAVAVGNPVLSSTPVGATGWNCADASPAVGYDCLWNDRSKQPGDTATLTFDVASLGATGRLRVAVVDVTLDPVALADADLDVIPAPTPTTTPPTSPTSPTSPTPVPAATAGTPAAGTPAAGTPAPGAPAPGAPAPGTPAPLSIAG